VVAQAHDRMPVVLEDAAITSWLTVPDGDGQKAEAAERARALLRPAGNDALVATRASTRVNAVKNDDPGCLVPDEPAADMPLFASVTPDKRG